MSKENLEIKLAEAVKNCKSDESFTVVEYPENLTDNRKNHFLVMMKPEVLDHRNGVDTDKAVSLILRKFEEFDVDIKACFVAGGSFIKERSLMEKQYFMLNKGCRTGLKDYPSDFCRSVEEENKDCEIVGAYEFAERYPEYTFDRLLQDSNKYGSRKIGNGLYMLELDYKGRKYGILNAFHPKQLEHFNNSKSLMVFFDCASDATYDDLAHKLIGFYDPSKADTNSLRGEIYNNSSAYRIPSVEIMYNGFHISPSPLEGMFATLRYSEAIGSDVNKEEININRKLIEKGFSMDQIMNLKKNPCVLIDNEWRALFELVEGKDEDFIVDFIDKIFSRLCY